MSGTETGNVLLTPTDPALPSYIGQFTSLFATTTPSANGTVTSSLKMHGVGSSGSVLNVELVQQFTMSTTGVMVSFGHLTCG